MEKVKPITELEVLEHLTELIEIIEKNNWQHLYKHVDIPVTSLSNRVSKEADEKIGIILDELQNIRRVITRIERL